MGVRAPWGRLFYVFEGLATSAIAHAGMETYNVPTSFPTIKPLKPRKQDLEDPTFLPDS